MDMISLCALTFTAIIAGQIERTLAIETGRQINACRPGRTGIVLAVGHIVGAVLASKSIKNQNYQFQLPVKHRFEKLLPFRTKARIPDAVINALGSVLANVRFARIKLILTSDARKVRCTRAIQTRSKVPALAAMHTRIANATFRCCFALLAIGATGAHTEIVLEQINACRIVLAWSLHGARLHLTFATRSRPTDRARALKTANAITANTIVQARIVFTVVHIDLASIARIPVATNTLEPIVQIHAALRSNRTARIEQALIDFRLALQANIARSTFAYVTVDLIHARSAIQTRCTHTIVDRVLALLARVSGFAVAPELVHTVNASTVILARIICAIVDIPIAITTRPARCADALIGEQPIHARAMFARLRQAQIDLLLAPFACKAGRTCATEIVHQIGTIRTQQARLLRTIVNVFVAHLSLPAGQTFTFEAALLQSQTSSSVGAWIAIRRARIDRDVTVRARVTAAAQAREITVARLIFAHGSRRARLIAAIARLLLTIHARISSRTLAPVTLRQIRTFAAIVARLRSTLIDIDLAASSRKAGWTETLYRMTHRYAKAAVLARAFRAHDWLAVVTRCRRHTLRSHAGRALCARCCTGCTLVEVLRTRRTWCQAGF